MKISLFSVFRSSSLSEEIDPLDEQYSIRGWDDEEKLDNSWLAKTHVELKHYEAYASLPVGTEMPWLTKTLMPAVPHLASWAIKALAILCPCKDTPDLSETPPVIREYHHFESWRKDLLLFCFSIAPFFDSILSASTFAALPSIAADLSPPLKSNEWIWIIMSYQVALGACLLIGSRISNHFGPKRVFLGGMFFTGLSCLVLGYMHKLVPFLIFRGLSGIGVALTLPSSSVLTSRMYPSPSIKGKLLNVSEILGLIIGAGFGGLISWPSSYRFVAFTSLFVAATVVSFIPADVPLHQDKSANMNIFGLIALLASAYLFIYSLVSSVNLPLGWHSPLTILPLITSALLCAALLLWNIPMTAFPNRALDHTIVHPMIFISIIPYIWWNAVQLFLTGWWRYYPAWRLLRVVTQLPPVCTGFALVTAFSGVFPSCPNPKWLMVFSQTLLFVAVAIIPISFHTQHYLYFAIASLFLGTLGSIILYATVKLVIAEVTPPEHRQHVGPLAYGATQMGSSISNAVLVSTQSYIDGTYTPRIQLHQLVDLRASTGRVAAALILLVIVMGSLITAIVAFRRPESRFGEAKKREEMEV